MSKQTVTFEVDVPDGFEIIGFREPQKGEIFLSAFDHQVTDAIDDWDAIKNGHRFIVRPIWWPAGIKAAYVARDSNGAWYAYKTRPVRNRYQWEAGMGEQWEINQKWIALEPPEIEDWKETLFANPNA